MDNLYASSRQYTLGGSYALNNLRLFASYNLTVSSGDTVATPANSYAATRSQMAWVGANYRLLPALTRLSGVYYATLNKSGGHGTLVTLGAKYDLSKRTSPYGTVASVFNSRMPPSRWRRRRTPCRAPGRTSRAMPASSTGSDGGWPVIEMYWRALP
jgi:predicted porin